MKTIVTIFIACISVTIYAQIPTDSLRGYYPLDGNLSDQSGNHNDGYFTSDITLTTDRDGKSCAMQIPYEDSSYFSLPDKNFGINGDSSFSISFWVKINDCNYGYVRLAGDTSANLLFIDCDTTFSNSKKPAMYISRERIPGVYERMSPGKLAYTPSIGTWEHHVLVCNGNAFNWYVNDTLVHIVSDSFPDIVSGMNRIIFSSANTDFDDIRVYNRVLDSNDVAALFHERGSCSVTGIASAFTPSSVPVIAPNPAIQGRFRIQTDATLLKIEVYDLSGRRIRSSDQKAVEGMKPGLYIVEIQTDQGISRQKLLVKD